MAELHDAVAVAVSFVRTVHTGRALRQHATREDQNFWNVIRGNLTDMAAIEWCKLFGADHQDHQPVHWKNLIPRVDHELLPVSWTPR